MSQDIQLAFPCPHLTIEERVALGTDRRSLETRQPVASGASVRILVNNEFPIPQGGLYSFAQLFSKTSGPFTILEDHNTLVVESSEGSLTLSLPVGPRVPTDDIIKLFKGQTDTLIAENVSSYLVFTDGKVIGPESFVRVSGTSVAALGFANQYGTRGRKIYPGWVLDQREDTITNRFPKFVENVRKNPVFKVTYSVPRERCLRCGGSFVENDYRFDIQGQMILIENENLLYQAALKILLTDRGSNPYHTWYGTSIRSRIGTKAVSDVATAINEDIRRSLGKLQDLQEAQSEFQVVTFKERLYQIQSVQTYQDENNPFIFYVDVVVQNASSDSINLSIVYTVPDVVSLVQGDGVDLRLG